MFTTGRTNYARSSTLTGVDLVANPDRLGESKIAAAEIVAVFATLPKPTTVEAAVRRVNGGLYGLAGVQAIYEKIAPGATKVTQGLAVPAAASPLAQ